MNTTSVQFTLTVNATPTANPQTDSVPHDTAKAITLTGSPAGVTFAMASQPTHGSLSGFNSTTGAVTYTPTTGYHGSDMFTFTATNGQTTSAPATVTLNVAVGTPTATAQTVAVGHDAATAVTLSSTDDDMPALTPAYTVVTQPAHGTLSGAAPNLTYTPSAGYHGADSFTFTANNGSNTSSPATVTLNVAVGTPTAAAQTVGTS